MGDGFQVPPETPHAGGKNGDKTTKIAITYVVEKGKPLASPAGSRIVIPKFAKFTLHIPTHCGCGDANGFHQNRTGPLLGRGAAYAEPGGVTTDRRDFAAD